MPVTPAAKKLPASHVVSESKHKGAAGFRASTMSSLTAVGAYFEQKAVVEKERVEEKKRVREATERREKVDMAKAILETADADDDMKAVAKQVLLQFLQS